MSLRLHIDIPLFEDEVLSAKKSEEIIALLTEAFHLHLKPEVNKFNYRLMSDEDRGAKNYLLKDALGHCTNNKCKVDL